MNGNGDREIEDAQFEADRADLNNRISEAQHQHDNEGGDLVGSHDNGGDHENDGDHEGGGGHESGDHEGGGDR